MQKHLHTLILCIMILCFTIFSLSACSQTGSADTTGTSGTPAASSASTASTAPAASAASSTSSTAVTGAFPMKFKDSMGREVLIEKQPQKVLSLAPNITETVFALGKGDMLVGRTDYCDYPSEAAKIPSVGTITDPSVEKIAALKPDLVIAASITKGETVSQLTALNIPIVVVKEEDSYDGVFLTIEKTGALLGTSDKARVIIADMQSKIADIKKKVAGAPAPVVYYVVGFGEYGDFTPGKGSFIDSTIQMAGGINAGSDAVEWKYSVEKLVQKNPDIVICSKYYDAAAGIRSANGYKDLKAVKAGHLYEIDNNLLDRSGPRVADGLEALAKIIHPDLFK